MLETFGCIGCTAACTTLEGGQRCLIEEALAEQKLDMGSALPARWPSLSVGMSCSRTDSTAVAKTAVATDVRTMPKRHAAMTQIAASVAVGTLSLQSTKQR